jgi:hypothetical protein
MQTPGTHALRFAACCLLTLATGCQLCHDYRPVTALVRDAETKKPIPGARVDIGYMTYMDFFAPFAAHGTAGKDGVVQVLVAPYKELLLMSTCADGYALEHQLLSTDKVREVRFWTASQQPTFVVELFAEPSATVELIVPNEFRGLITLETEATDSSQWVPGQRRFSANVPASGVVTIDGPPQLLDAVLVNVEARLANGTRLNRYSTEDEVGLLYLDSGRSCRYYVVGTQQDLRAVEKIVYERKPNGTITGMNEAAIKALQEASESSPTTR